MGLGTRGWVAGDRGERYFRAICEQGWPAGVEGNQKNGGQEGTSSMDRYGRGPGPGLA